MAIETVGSAFSPALNGDVPKLATVPLAQLQQAVEQTAQQVQQALESKAEGSPHEPPGQQAVDDARTDKPKDVDDGSDNGDRGTEDQSQAEGRGGTVDIDT